MTRGPVRILSTALLTALVLTGCGTSESPSAVTNPSPSRPTPSASTGPSETPSGVGTETGAASTLPGGQVQGRSGAYTVIAPAGWGEATDQAGTGIAGLDLVLLSSKKVSKFNDNLVVLTTSGGAATVDQEMKKGRTLMKTAGREVSDAGDVQIAGVTAKSFTSRFELKGVRITARSFGMTRAGKVYLLTLSSSPDDAANALSAFGDITHSWKWS